MKKLIYILLLIGTFPVFSQELPHNNQLMLSFSDSMIHRKATYKTENALVMQALNYAGYPIFDKNPYRGLENFTNKNTFLLTGITERDSIYFIGNDNDSVKLPLKEAYKYFSSKVLPGDLIYSMDKLFGKMYVDHIAIIKQVHQDGTLSVYDSYYKDGSFMRKGISVISYNIYNEQNYLFARP